MLLRVIYNASLLEFNVHSLYKETAIAKLSRINFLIKILMKDPDLFVQDTIVFERTTCISQSVYVCTMYLYSVGMSMFEST